MRRVRRGRRERRGGVCGVGVDVAPLLEGEGARARVRVREVVRVRVRVSEGVSVRVRHRC